jgi:hypothetical protein
MKSIALLLAHASVEHVNSCVSARDLRTPLHLACAMGNLPVAQLLIWVSQLFSLCRFSIFSSMFLIVKGNLNLKFNFLINKVKGPLAGIIIIVVTHYLFMFSCIGL